MNFLRKLFPGRKENNYEVFNEYEELLGVDGREVQILKNAFSFIIKETHLPQETAKWRTLFTLSWICPHFSQKRTPLS